MNGGTDLEIVELGFVGAPDRVVETVVLGQQPDGFVSVVAVIILPFACFSIVVGSDSVQAFCAGLEEHTSYYFDHNLASGERQRGSRDFLILLTRRALTNPQYSIDACSRRDTAGS